MSAAVAAAAVLSTLSPLALSEIVPMARYLASALRGRRPLPRQ